MRLEHDFTDKEKVIRLFIAVLATIFAVELGIMLIIVFVLPPEPVLIISFLDSLVLVLIVFPVIYFLNYRPLLVQINERKQAEQALKRLNDELEVRVRERTAELEEANRNLKSEINERKEAEDQLRSVSTYVRTLIEASLDPFATIGPDGKITDVNRAAELVTGVPREKLIGSHFSEYFTEPEKAKEAYEKVFSKGLIKDYPLAIRHTSGKVTDVLYNATVYRDQKGEVQGVFAAARDITERKLLEKALRKEHEELELRVLERTVELKEANEALEAEINERKQTEKALLESELRYRMLFEKAGDAIFILEAEGENTGKIIAANRAAAMMHGCTIDDLLGLDITDLDTPDTAAAAEQRIRRMLRGEWVNAEIAHRKKDGTVFPVEISAGLLEVGKHKYILAFDRDITERKQAEEKLKNYAAGLEEANRIKDLFTDIMHHDLLNPLGAIKLLNEIQLRESVEEDKQKILLMMKKNIEKIIEMIKSANIYARIENVEKLEKENLDLNRVFREVIDNFTPQIDEKNMKLEYPAKCECYAMANPMIENVFSNLLSNAIKYSPTGEKIEVNIICEKNYCKIYVKDWGCGIKDEDKTMIFDRFHRLHKISVKGTGLGLAIAKRIVELHKGRIWVEDNPEGGSVFYVEIPKSW